MFSGELFSSEEVANTTLAPALDKATSNIVLINEEGNFSNLWFFVTGILPEDPPMETFP